MVEPVVERPITRPLDGIQEPGLVQPRELGFGEPCAEAGEAGAEGIVTEEFGLHGHGSGFVEVTKAFGDALTVENLRCFADATDA